MIRRLLQASNIDVHGVGASGPKRNGAGTYHPYHTMLFRNIDMMTVRQMDPDRNHIFRLWLIQQVIDIPCNLDFHRCLLLY